MCGIVGLVSPECDSLIRLMTDRLAHRGPDDKGYFVDRELALGHRRLSILELSSMGHQPMVSRDGRFVIIFNGEIYNHLELRKNMLFDSDFRGNSDTETLLYGLIKYGINFVKELNGIFVFAFYDKQTRDLYLCRDPFGVKPLYFYYHGGNLAFASELKSLLLFQIDKAINYKALANYLYYLYCPGESTPFKYIRKLKPGHFIKTNINRISECIYEQYYELPFDGKYSYESERECLSLFDAKLTTAINRQLLSDVPVGFFLSGGLDSSAVVAIARKLYPHRKLQCYTIDTGGSYDGFRDDLYYAKLAAKHLNVDLEVVKADIDIIRDFDKMIWHLDEPQADAAPLNVLSICNLARSKGDIVLLGGTAGDDLLSGYRRHRALNFEKYFDLVPDMLWKGVNKISSLLPSDISFIRRLDKISTQSGKSTIQRLAGYYGWLNQNEIIKLFVPELQTIISEQRPEAILINSLKAIPNEKSLLNQLLYWDLKFFLTDHNLNYTDKMSMAEGIEVRVPFLDKDLVEFSTKIHPSLKMKGQETKYILKKLMENYLPREIIYRPKTGFGAPVRRWIMKDLDSMISERLSKDNLTKWGVFDPSAIHKLINDNKKGHIDASYSIWALLAIHSWLEQFSK